MSYTYLIGWSALDKYYYGVRYAKVAVPEELWVTYKTSSKYVKKFAEKYGDPDVVSVRKIFNNTVSALLWESKVLRRMNVVSRDDFLNRWDNNMVPLNTSGPFPFEDPSVQEKVDLTLRSKYGSRGSGCEKIKQKIFDTNKRKYGSRSTCMLDHVKLAREESSMLIYGTTNPFNNPAKLSEVMVDRYGVSNMMFDPVVKEKHKLAMECKDWTLRNEKSKLTNVEKYGTSCTMNQSGIRELHSRKCPFGCKDGHKYDAGNFTNHMTRIHKWTKDQVNEYKNEN